MPINKKTTILAILPRTFFNDALGIANFVRRSRLRLTLSVMQKFSLEKVRGGFSTPASGWPAEVVIKIKESI